MDLYFQMRLYVGVGEFSDNIAAAYNTVLGIMVIRNEYESAFIHITLAIYLLRITFVLSLYCVHLS